MLKIKVNNGTEHTVEFSDSGQTRGEVNHVPFTWDLVALKKGSYHAIKDNKSYTIELIYMDLKEKTMRIRVNGNNYSVAIKDKFDELLQSLGMDKFLVGKINEIKAPMPGLVLDIRVTVGDVVKKGDSLLVLEAMKMENSLKSPEDGVITKIHVEKGVAVEKNQLLLSFN